MTNIDPPVVTYRLTTEQSNALGYPDPVSPDAACSRADCQRILVDSAAGAVCVPSCPQRGEAA